MKDQKLHTHRPARGRRTPRSALKMSELIRKPGMEQRTKAITQDAHVTLET